MSALTPSEAHAITPHLLMADEELTVTGGWLKLGSCQNRPRIGLIARTSTSASSHRYSRMMSASRANPPRVIWVSRCRDAPGQPDAADDQEKSSGPARRR